jgi:membrane-anchored glycerophosphoryl diester phosphodiesterase (GDPDase)
LLTLVVNVITALVGNLELIRNPLQASGEPPFSRGQYVAVVAFVIFVGFLAFYGIISKAGAIGTNGGIFPEIMSPFTLRSFGVFYFTVALAVVPYLWNHNLKAILHHSFASYGLIVFITIAAFVYLPLFDFASKPGGLLYFGAYLGVGIPIFFVFRRLGTGN